MTDLSHLRAARTRTAGQIRTLRLRARSTSGQLAVEVIGAVLALRRAGVPAQGIDDHGPYPLHLDGRIDRLAGERDRALADLAEARRVLEPLLADPHFGTDDWCVFCYDGSHTPECPVLRADALLGRGAGQPGEEGT